MHHTFRYVFPGERFPYILHRHLRPRRKTPVSLAFYRSRLVLHRPVLQISCRPLLRIFTVISLMQHVFDKQADSYNQYRLILSLLISRFPRICSHASCNASKPLGSVSSWFSISRQSSSKASPLFLQYQYPSFLYVSSGKEEKTLSRAS